MRPQSEINQSKRGRQTAARFRPGLVALVFLLLQSVCGAFPGYKAPGIEQYVTPPSPVPGMERAPAATDENTPKGPLTLSACIRIALAKNPLVQAVREGVGMAQAGAGMARAPYYPEVSASTAYRYRETHAFLPQGLAGTIQPSTIGPTHDWSFRVNVGYILFDSGARAARLRSALAQQSMAEADANRVRQSVALEVHRTFYGLLYALEARDVAEKNLQRAEELLRIARLKESAGTATHADVARAQVEVANARLELVKADSGILIARGGLNTALGLPVDQELSLCMDPEETIFSAMTSLPDALNQALHARPELAAALNRIGAAQSAIREAKSAFGPRVMLNGGYGYRDTDFFPEDKDWSVGITVELPIFQGFSRTHALARARHAHAKEEAGIRQLILQVRQEVWVAYQKAGEAREAVKAAEILVKDAKESLQISRQQYEAGAATMNDLLSAQTALARAELIAADYRWRYRVANAVLAHATGSILQPGK